MRRFGEDIWDIAFKSMTKNSDWEKRLNHSRIDKILLENDCDDIYEDERCYRPFAHYSDGGGSRRQLAMMRRFPRLAESIYP